MGAAESEGSLDGISGPAAVPECFDGLGSVVGAEGTIGADSPPVPVGGDGRYGFDPGFPGRGVCGLGAESMDPYVAAFDGL